VIKIEKYIAKRLLILIPVLFGVSLIVFMMIRLIPGDPARVIMGPKARPESIQLFHERYGLDKPVAVQYALWLGHMLRGDMGESLRTHTPVLEELLLRLPHTLELAATSFLVGATLGIGFGILASVYRNSPVDYATMVAALAGLSVPIFWLGLLLIFLFSVTLGWLPTGGRMGYDVSVESLTSLPLLDSLLTANWQAFIDLLKHLLMPTVTLATPIIAVTARMTRSSMLEVMSQDYIRTARAKGLRERIVMSRHALRNAMLPIVTVLGLDVGWLLGGAVVTESIFAWPGVGRYVFEAIKARDYPAVQASILFIATAFVLVNLGVDILYAYINPRIRYE
jgi:peptide/nickel transport system permease protein